MIACLLVPSPGLACALAERPALRGRPLALSDEAGLRVLDATAEAAARGVRPGMTLREAAAFCPPLAVVEPRPARLARLLDRLRAALEAVSPLVESPALDALLDPLARDPGQRDAALYADLRGTHALYPTLDHLARAVFAALSSTAEAGGGTSAPRSRAAGEGGEAETAPWAGEEKRKRPRGPRRASASPATASPPSPLPAPSPRLRRSPLTR